MTKEGNFTLEYEIIDFHAHVFPDKIAKKATDHLHEYYHLDMAANGYVSELFESARKNKVSKILIHSTATTSTQVENVNDFVADIVANNQCAIGFGTVHYAYNNIENEIERMVKLGLKGIKLHPDFQNFNIDDEKMFVVYEKATELGLPILFHLGDRTSTKSSPKRMANMLDRYPKMTVIGAHLGGVFAWEESWKELVGRELYFDCSSVFDILGEEQAEEIIRAHGVEKILFGTDFPIKLHNEEIQHVLNLNLTHEERKMIFSENAKKLLSIK